MSGPIGVTDTTFGEAGWSRFGSRLGSDAATPVLAAADLIGFHAIEVIGPAHFEAHARAGGPSPWDHLRRARTALTATPLMAVVSGQALAQERSVADDTVELFVKTLAGLGVDIIRAFDPLNDLRNLRTLVAAALAEGLRVEGCLCYSREPDGESWSSRWREGARGLVELGCESVVLRDSGGLLVGRANRVVEEMRTAVAVPVRVSSRGANRAAMAYLAAVDSGATGVDTTLSSLSGPLSHPSVESMKEAFGWTVLDPDRLAALEIDLNLLIKDCPGEPTRLASEANASSHSVPPALVDDVARELALHASEARLGEVLEEVSALVNELGHPPLESPVRQMVASQAVLNVIGGERYETVTQALKDYLHGLWGRPPLEVSSEVRRQVLGRDEALTVRPADLLTPQVEVARAQLRKIEVDPNDENTLISILFPELDAAFYEDDAPVAPVVAADEEGAVSEPADEPEAKVTISEFDVEVEGEVFRVRVTPAGTAVLVAGAAAASSGPPAAGPGMVMAPMQGLIVKIPVKKGDEVRAGDVVAVLEAMKMQNDIVAPTSGKVVDIHVKEGDVVTPKQPLVTVR